MAASNGRGGSEEQLKKMEDLNKVLKEGERLLAPTRRPDGTLRKAIKIRAGYVPPEEVPIYQSKGALWKKEMASLQDAPPGYTPPTPDAKPKTKSVKRNERKKEKRLQAAAGNGKQSETLSDEDISNEELSSGKSKNKGSATVDLIVSKMNELAVSTQTAVGISQSVDVESLDARGNGQDIDKKIRALKKKIRLAEAQLQNSTSQELKPEHLDKLKKLEGWREELKLLEDTKT